MFTRSLLSLSVAWIFILLCDGSFGKRQWDYEPISIESTSSDEKMFKVETHVEIVGRAGYVISGSLMSDLIIDENTMVEATAYRSSSGSADDYKLLPWSIPKQTFKKFADSYYKNMVYKNLESCSNIPDPDHIYPLANGKYIFEKCVVTGDGMPEVVPEGYYKVIFVVSGPVDAGFIAIVKITTKNDLIG